MPRIYNSHQLRRRHARKLFGKKAVRAIKKIAQKPVETKYYHLDINVATNATVGPLTWTGSNVILGHNIWNNVPRADSTSVRSRSEMIGQECQGRGFSLKWAIYYPAVRSPEDSTIDETLRVRVSVVKAADYFPFNASSGWEKVSSTASFFDDEDTNVSPPTLVRFNTDFCTVMKSKSFTLNPYGQKGLLSRGKMWVPIKKRIQAADPEPTTGTSSFVGKLKGFQYYVLIELWSPYTLENIGAITNNWVFILNSRVYFKDA